jgi:hypothetical protein
MAMMSSPSQQPARVMDERAARTLETLVDDLRRVFANRLHALVAYDLDDGSKQDDIRTLALVEHLTFDDLTRCVPLARGWQQRGLAVPLILTRREFLRTLDVFPLEYSHIIAHHVVLVGEDPFEGARVSDGDRRRACELQAKSHVVHLREGFLEAGGRPRQVARLIAASVPAFRTLLEHLAQLEDAGSRIHRSDEELAGAAAETVGVPAPLVQEILAAPRTISTIVDPTVLAERYIEASERIWRYVDTWRS